MLIHELSELDRTFDRTTILLK